MTEKLAMQCLWQTMDKTQVKQDYKFNRVNSQNAAEEWVRASTGKRGTKRMELTDSNSLPNSTNMTKYRMYNSVNEWMYESSFQY